MTDTTKTPSRDRRDYFKRYHETHKDNQHRYDLRCAAKRITNALGVEFVYDKHGIPVAIKGGDGD